MLPGINNLNSKQWGDWLNEVKTDKNHYVIAYNGKDFQFIPKEAVAHYKPVDLKTIVGISLALLQTKKSSVEDRKHIAHGLLSIMARRGERFNELGTIRKWFGRGAHTKEQLKIATIVSVLLNPGFVDKINQGVFYEGLSLKLRQVIFNTLKYNPEVQPRQLAALGESIAQAYIDKKDYAQAIKMRGEVGNIEVSPELVKALNAPGHLLVHGKVVDHLGGATVKRGQVSVKVREIDNQTVTSFDFKISHPARAKLEKTLKEFETHFKDSVITVRRVKDGYYLADKDDKFSKNHFHDAEGLAMEVNFPDYGKVIVGCGERDGGNACTSNWVRVELAPRNENSSPEIEVQIASKMLASLGLNEVFHPQTEDDVARMEIFKILRAHIPQTEYRLTRDPMLYHLPAQELREIIEARYPFMQRIFETGLGNLEQDMRAAGAVGLMVGVHGSNKTLNSTVGSLLKQGILSAQTILELGHPVGASANESLKAGGGDSVHTHLVTKREIDQKVPITESAGQAPVQLLVDLKAMQDVGYGYDTRHEGAKTRAIYEGRDNLTRFVNKQQIGMTHPSDNEYRVKEIPPRFIKRIVVQTEAMRASLLQSLSQTFPEGSVNGIPLKDFVQVSSAYNVAQWGPEAVEAEKKIMGNVPFPHDLKELVPAEGESEALPKAMIVGGNRLKYTLESEARPVHAAHAVAVSRAYELMGARVPHVIDFEKQPNGPADAPGALLLAEHIQGDSVLGHVRESSGHQTDERREKIRRELQKHFVLDCLLSNKDVLGEGYKHVVVDPDGNPWRVNLKGAGVFYENGKPKKNISNRVIELDSLRDPYIYPQAASIYGSIPEDEIASQISDIETHKDELLQLFQEPYRSKLESRMHDLSNRKEKFIEQEQALITKLNADLATPGKTVTYPIDSKTSRIISPKRNWDQIERKELNEPPIESGKVKLSVGVLIEEKGGRFWIYHPKGKGGKDSFPSGEVKANYKRPKLEMVEGNYQVLEEYLVGDYTDDEREALFQMQREKHYTETILPTFHAAHVNEQLILQRTAHKNVWEQTGLEIELSSHVHDMQIRPGEILRVYKAKRIGGGPFGATEASAVRLAALGDLSKLLSPKDQLILSVYTKSK